MIKMLRVKLKNKLYSFKELDQLALITHSRVVSEPSGLYLELER